MTEAFDHEIAAIQAVLAALEPLEAGVRANVLDYVLKRLGIVAPAPPPPPPSGAGQVLPPAPPGSGSVHIRAFKEQKKPRSANEMAAVVAYYLANLAPIVDRKQTVSTKDIETQSKIAGFPLPKTIRVTLQNARNAGYFDSTGDGEYRLNPVGHNLVVHNMPRGDGEMTKFGGGRSKKGNKGTRVRRKK